MNSMAPVLSDERLSPGAALALAGEVDLDGLMARAAALRDSAG